MGAELRQAQRYSNMFDLVQDLFFKNILKQLFCFCSNRSQLKSDHFNHFDFDHFDFDHFDFDHFDHFDFLYLNMIILSHHFNPLRKRLLSGRVLDNNLLLSRTPLKCP